MTTLQFLVSTMNNRFDAAGARLDPARCIVVNQVDEPDLDRAEAWASPIRSVGGVVVNVAERGLSKSRNRAIAAAKGDICVISDDDIIFDADASERLEAMFRDHPEADVITFQARSDKGHPLRRYPPTSYKHTVLTSLNVVSIEIAFRLDAVRRSHVQFDERFGLGAEYVSGEENIFVSDLVRSGLAAIYVPECIVTHSGEPSGGQFESDRVAISKGAIIRRVLGKFSLPIVVLFAIKKSVQHEENPARMISLAVKGWRKL
ncbi:MAG: glycosyltransferase [Hyphomicrobiales bacterium]|nr:MAG: glycosyltransferase [Hyphomicrobiales bacterium]